MAYPLAGHTNSYHTYGFDEALAGIAAAGFKHVELTAVPGWTEHVDLDASPAAVRKKLEGYGLEAVSISGHSDLTTPDGLEHGIKAVRWAAEYGIPIMNTAVGGHQSADENEAAFLGNIGKLADAAETAGVVVALEIHGDIMASSDVTIPLLEKIGRDSVKVNYDTANVEFYSGDLAVDDLPKITPYLAHVHLKDTTGGKGNWDFPAVGDGIVDFARVLAILEQAGYKGRTRSRSSSAASRGPRSTRSTPRCAAPTSTSRGSGCRDWSAFPVHAGDDEPPGARVPGGRRAHGARAGRFDGGSRRPRPAVDGRLHPARGCEAGGPGARSPRRPADPVRHRARPPRRARARASAYGHVPRSRARRLPLADGCRLHQDRPAERPLLQFARARVRRRAIPRRAARGSPGLPVPVLGGAQARGGGAVPVRQRRHPRQRGGDLDRARDRRGALRHGASPRLYARLAGAAHQRARAARPALPRHAGLVLGAAPGRGRSLGKAERVDAREGRGVPRLVHARGRRLRARPRSHARPDRAGYLRTRPKR